MALTDVEDYNGDDVQALLNAKVSTSTYHGMLGELGQGMASKSAEQKAQQAVQQTFQTVHQHAGHQFNQQVNQIANLHDQSTQQNVDILNDNRVVIRLLML